MARGRVVVTVSRIPAPGHSTADPGPPPTSRSGLRSLTAPSVLDDAAGMFTDGSVDAIGYASTSTAYAIGFDAEAEMVAGLAQRRGLAVAGTALSAVAALSTGFPAGPATMRKLF